jgi:multisubunit Na+/H+ antiporter MnhE subunit
MKTIRYLILVFFIPILIGITVSNILIVKKIKNKSHQGTPRVVELYVPVPSQFSVIEYNGSLFTYQHVPTKEVEKQKR